VFRIVFTIEVYCVAVVVVGSGADEVFMLKSKFQIGDYVHIRDGTRFALCVVGDTLDKGAYIEFKNQIGTVENVILLGQGYVYQVRLISRAYVTLLHEGCLVKTMPNDPDDRAA